MCAWCDTPGTWVYDDRHVNAHESGLRWNPQKELKRRSLYELVNEIEKAETRLCVITGGEPLLQAEPLAALISTLNESVLPRDFEIETAGTLSPQALQPFENVAFNVSPKLASSGNQAAKRFLPAVLREFVAHPNARFKFVVDTRCGHPSELLNQELAEVRKIALRCEIPPERIWLMPCGTTEYDITSGLRVLAPIAMQHQYNLTTRLHVYSGIY